MQSLRYNHLARVGKCQTNDIHETQGRATNSSPTQPIGNPCEHACVDLHDGTYECTCFYGFTLAVDGYSCARLAPQKPQTSAKADNFPQSTIASSKEVANRLAARETNQLAGTATQIAADNNDHSREDVRTLKQLASATAIGTVSKTRLANNIETISANDKSSSLQDDDLKVDEVSRLSVPQTDEDPDDYEPAERSAEEATLQPPWNTIRGSLAASTTTSSLLSLLNSVANPIGADEGKFASYQIALGEVS